MKSKEKYQYSTGSQLRFEVLKMAFLFLSNIVTFMNQLTTKNISRYTQIIYVTATKVTLVS